MEREAHFTSKNLSIESPFHTPRRNAVLKNQLILISLRKILGVVFKDHCGDFG